MSPHARHPNNTPATSAEARRGWTLTAARPVAASAARPENARPAR